MYNISTKNEEVINMYQVIEEKITNDGIIRTVMNPGTDEKDANRIAQLLKEDAEPNTYYVVYPV